MVTPVLPVAPGVGLTLLLADLELLAIVGLMLLPDLPDTPAPALELLGALF